MYNKYLPYILLFALSIFFQPMMAQELSISDIQNIKVSQLSDEQVTQAWKKLQDSGISEQDAYKLLAQKGMPATEVEALKDRVALLGLNKKATVKSSTPEKKKIDFSRDIDDSVITPKAVKPTAPAPAPPALTIYGSEFFNQSAIKFEPNFSVATPKGYVLGPGDEVIVLVNGLNESSVRSKVSPEGNLQIPYAGIVYVNGFTIEQATGLIKSKMTKVYPALNSGQTRLSVNLGNTRSIKITIVGEVKTPGSYTLSSLSTLFNALYNSGGPNNNGSLRNIELIRNNKVFKTVDFYTFLEQGLLDGNIRLEDQDVIRIPVYKKRVGIRGEVKRPAIYELKENEQLENLIKYAGGYTDVAYKGAAKVDQINTLEREVKDVPANLFSNYIPRNGDMVEIGAITNRYTNRIMLEGSVYRPGIYELTAGFTLGQLLKNAQGLKPEAYMERGYIKRTLPNLEKDFISFKPTDIISGKNDIPLLREDSVVILDREVFTSNQKITVNGYVRNPSIFTYRKGLKLADAIAMSGGFADEAADHHVEVSRIIKNESDSVANQLVHTFIVDLDKLEGNAGEMELQPMDFVYVPRLVNYRSLGNVKVKGEVVFPGDYAVQKRDETALDFLKRAGGITPYGSLENAQVYRRGIRVNLDLASTSKEPGVNKDMIMLPGDSVYVPRVISYVEVSGAVNNPQYISYAGRSFKYYINAAAGTTQNARLKGAYIKYPDGLNRPVRHFLFFRNYPAVKPGSKIVVPEKTPDTRFKIGFGDIGGLAAVLTAIVSLVAIIHK
ncbi:MAG: SLBB domain-containing protein [Mucilaginibacter sp.]|uniref:SLBB domain-containing protein n=1 Tax=Mucilaginibacter sp. TaxID=1882438 RepID=UPI0031ADFA0F